MPPDTTSPFIVLIERCLQLLRRARPVLALGLMLGLALMAVERAHAQTLPSSKVAADLRRVIDGGPTPALNWTRTIGGVRYVKVLIVSSSPDPELADLRAKVLASGGSVYYRYLSVTALSVLLPAQRVDEIARRVDVQSISPNRLTARTASALELATGAAQARDNGGALRLDGSGVGVAILDSGIAWNHHGMRNPRGQSRVARAVNVQRVGDTAIKGKDWTPGIDVSASLTLGSKTLEGLLKSIAVDRDSKADVYGHGTHVASVAAGNGSFRSPDTTGIAPNATLYDVQVLDGEGYGQVSDVLAGIDWVIGNARAYNIRVMNLSLSSDSTESYLTDPLCRAARSAVAAGITVVVAAGNYGKSANGAEVYGSIGSPGIEPSVITVGSVNTRGTAARGDDIVNQFS
ncbi:MAG: S8 family serine peptidase, partial [Ideonella sp.]|nr:S8 family serine peptidase [Ideonella sp.]